MPKVSIKTLEETQITPLPPAFSGPSECRAYFDGPQDPLHLHLHELAAGDGFRIESGDTDRLAYVWRGLVEAGDVKLAAGSSLIVEHGRSLEVTGIEAQSRILTFAAADPRVQSRKGGNVHLLPAERVPRCEMQSGLRGGMHADSACSSCELWLHENHFPAQRAVSAEASEKGIHAHTEDEIIFVTDGEIHFGTKTGGPGTAVAIAADTFYSFTPGPEGLSFINFRACTPTDIKFKTGGSMSETGYWRELVSRPEYLKVG